MAKNLHRFCFLICTNQKWPGWVISLSFSSSIFPPTNRLFRIDLDSYWGSKNCLLMNLLYWNWVVDSEPGKTNATKISFSSLQSKSTENLYFPILWCWFCRIWPQKYILQGQNAQNSKNRFFFLRSDHRQVRYKQASNMCLMARWYPEVRYLFLMWELLFWSQGVFSFCKWEFLFW